MPGVSIAYVSDGKVRSPITLGLANIEKKIPVRSTTLFQACSLTKTLTSALVIMEFEQRKISLDTAANKILKRWQIPANGFGKDVTVRMLLNHTGAISNPYPDGGMTLVPKKATLEQQFGMPPAINPPLRVEHMPGDTYKYCNGCYAVLQMIIEDLTEKDYRSLLASRILKPLGMNHSLFDDNLLNEKPINVALNYDDAHKLYPPQRPMPIYATGSLWSTPSDLLKFVMEVSRALRGESAIIPQTVAHELVEPSSTATRGLGFFIGNDRGDEKALGEYFFHGGQNVGYLAMMIGKLDGSSAAVVMINISSPWTSPDFPHFGFVKNTVALLLQRPLGSLSTASRGILPQYSARSSR